jgi:hypothetical protein
MESNNQTARIAGLLYLLLSITGAFSILYIPSAIGEIGICFWLLIMGVKEKQGRV